MNTYLFEMNDGTYAMVNMTQHEYYNEFKQFGSNIEMTTLKGDRIRRKDVSYVIGKVVSTN